MLGIGLLLLLRGQLFFDVGFQLGQGLKRSGLFGEIIVGFRLLQLGDLLDIDLKADFFILESRHAVVFRKSHIELLGFAFFSPIRLSSKPGMNVRLPRSSG